MSLEPLPNSSEPVEIGSDVIYTILSNNIENEYEPLLLALYETLQRIDNKKENYSSSISELEGIVERQTREIHQWEKGATSLLHKLLSSDAHKENKDTLQYSFMRMMQERDKEIPYIDNCKDRLKRNLPISKSYALILSMVFDILIEILEDLIPEEGEVTIDLYSLSEEEMNELKNPTTSEISINSDAVRISPENINVPGNHIVLDVHKLDPRMVEAIKMAHEKSSGFVSIPSQALKDPQNNAPRARFPEQDPGNPEEANREDYAGDDYIDPDRDPDDGMPF